MGPGGEHVRRASLLVIYICIVDSTTVALIAKPSLSKAA